MTRIPAFGPWTEACHIGKTQENAIKAAQEANISPYKGMVDTEKQSALFWGSGKDLYTTTLAKCTCGAFRGIAPCKHIYRLAMELGIIDLPFQTGKTKGEILQEQIRWNFAVDEIEKLPDRAQITIMNMLNESVDTVRGEDEDALRECSLFEVTENGNLRIIENFTKARRTVLRYLQRKFECEYFPDDYITRELTRRGYNRSLNGYQAEKKEAETEEWKQQSIFEISDRER